MTEIRVEGETIRQLEKLGYSMEVDKTRLELKDDVCGKVLLMIEPISDYLSLVLWTENMEEALIGTIYVAYHPKEKKILIYSDNTIKLIEFD